jgi:hypothetical protein
MALPNIPTTEDRAAANLARFEAKINQEAPLPDRAFLRTLSVIEAANDTGLSRYVIDAARQNLAQTAAGDNLKFLGAEYGVVYKPAVAAVLSITGEAAGGTSVETTNSFVGEDNGMRYDIDADGTESGGSIDLTITASVPGDAGNLNATRLVTIETEVSGVSSSFEVVETITEGLEEENIEVYRQRVLAEIRTVGGGGNAVDYRRWGERPSTVLRVFPYAGTPDGPATSAPGDRTVFVETTPSVDPDGLADQSVLDEVRESITTNSVTGTANQPLGLTDETLYVVSIIRTAFDIAVYDIIVDPDDLATVKSTINSEVDIHLRSLVPYVDGVDIEFERNDTITTPSVSKVVQGVLERFGGTFTEVVVFQGGNVVTKYMLAQGEMAKRGVSTWP